MLPHTRSRGSFQKVMLWLHSLSYKFPLKSSYFRDGSKNGSASLVHFLKFVLNWFVLRGNAFYHHIACHSPVFPASHRTMQNSQFYNCAMLHQGLSADSYEAFSNHGSLDALYKPDLPRLWIFHFQAPKMGCT